MFIKNLECWHGCNMENFPAASTRDAGVFMDSDFTSLKSKVK